MSDIDTAIVFTRPEDSQRLWLGFSHFENFSHEAARGIKWLMNHNNEADLSVTAAELIAQVIAHVGTETEMQNGRWGVTFDYPPNILHSIFDFNFSEGVVTLYDSDYDEVKTSWSIHKFLERLNA